MKNRYCDPFEKDTVDLANVKMIHVGLPRSGTRFQYQCICDVIREGVLFTHDASSLPTDRPTWLSIRDPRDCLVSHWRFREAGEGRIPKDAIERLAPKYAECARLLVEFANRLTNRFAFVRYEQWRHRPELFMSIIERVAYMPIDQAVKQRILHNHSIGRNRQICDGKLDVTLDVPFEPGHVREGQVGTWKQFVDTRRRRILNDMLADAIERLGYDI